MADLEMYQRAGLGYLPTPAAYIEVESSADYRKAYAEYQRLAGQPRLPRSSGQVPVGCQISLRRIEIVSLVDARWRLDACSALFYGGSITSMDIASLIAFSAY